MKRIISVAALLVLFVTSPLLAKDWSKVTAQLNLATFPLQTDMGNIYCTGFMIDSARGYALTAAHCVDDQEGNVKEIINVGKDQATVVFFDADLDVAVLHSVTINRPSILPAKEVKVGQELLSFGFARESGLYGHFRAGNVAGIGSVDELPSVWVITDQPFIGGMSGGPVVDKDGKLIAMVQRSDRALTGIGRSIGAIWAATKEYWAK